MKRFIHFVLVVLIMAVAAWALLRGFHVLPGGTKEEATGESTAGSEKEHVPESREELTVLIEKEKLQGLGIETAQPREATMESVRVAFGRVLDPSPLVALDGEFSALEAALAASHAEYERTQKLLSTGENTSKRAAETAEAQFRADEIKMAALRRQVVLQWGATASISDKAARRSLLDALVGGEAALVRVDLLPADTVSEQPASAKLIVVGRELQPMETTWIVPASDADPRTQAQGFILRVEKPPFALRPGMSLTAWLKLPGQPRPGVEIPRSAILRHDGQTWVYIQEEEGKFVRKPVALDSPQGSGWFVADAKGGLSADDKLVVSGSQVLLSEELKAAGGTAEEE